MKRYDRLSQLNIKKPCSADWDAMTGDETMRFCGGCRKHVHNLSEMPAEEAEALLQSGPVCVRYRSDARGRIITKTALIASAAMIVAGCSPTTEPDPTVGILEQPETTVTGDMPVQEPPQNGPIMGAAPAPPEDRGVSMGKIASPIVMGEMIAPPDNRGDATFKKSIPN